MKPVLWNLLNFRVLGFYNTLKIGRGGGGGLGRGGGVGGQYFQSFTVESSVSCNVSKWEWVRFWGEGTWKSLNCLPKPACIRNVHHCTLLPAIGVCTIYKSTWHGLLRVRKKYQMNPTLLSSSSKVTLLQIGGISVEARVWICMQSVLTSGSEVVTPLPPLQQQHQKVHCNISNNWHYYNHMKLTVHYCS